MLAMEAMTEVIHRSDLKASDVNAFMSSLIKSSVPSGEKHVWFNSIQSHLKTILAEFEKHCYPGLEPFNLNDLLLYLTDDTQFDLELKKEKGKGVLYGFQHTRLRADVVNGLPDPVRLEILTRKIEATDVFSKKRLKDFGLYDAKSFRDAVVDIQDIGMGHSVYKVDFGSAQWVIKSRDQSYQTFFSEFLERCDWPSYRTVPVVNNSGRWDVSEFLGDTTLGLHYRSGEVDTLIEGQLARHAALGDVMGRGDRHFANYLVHKNALYPIDLSYLFWEDNEDWVHRYVSGGMAEFSGLAMYLEDSAQLAERTDAFFKEYYDTLEYLKENHLTVLTFIRSFFGPSPETDRHCRFVSERLEHIDTYFRSQKQLYLDAFQEMARRVKYKNVLVRIGDRHPGVLAEYPVLKMYYLADRDRLSAFFLVKESGHESVFATIEELGKKFLTLPEGYFA